MATSVFINEFHYDNEGGDVGEFVEIAGPAGTDLTGWSLVRYNGSTPAAATVYVSPAQLTSFTGLTIPDLGGGFGTVSIAFDVNGLQNGGNDGFALVDDEGTVVQLLSYEGLFTAGSGVAAGQTSEDVGVAQGASTPIGSSLGLIGTGRFYEDFVWAVIADDTPGGVNQGQTFEGGGPSAGVSVSPLILALSEGGAAASFTVVLDAAPTADVTISVVGDGEVGVSTALLVFTAENWDEPQTVSVTAIDDDEVEGLHAGTVSLGAAVSEDAAYDGLAVADVTATITDNDIAITRIHTIQGTGATSPLVNSVVTVRAIVTGDFQLGDADTTRNLENSGGFFLQEADADVDGDPLTSEGIFVLQNGVLGDVAVGQVVQVTGTVRESFGRTQINATSIEVVSSGSPLPEAVGILLPTVGVTLNQNGAYQPDLEAYEGMRVEFPQTLTISEQFNLDRSNEIRLVAGERETTFTQDNAPSVDGFLAHRQELGARTIVYEDGENRSSAQNQPINNLDGFGPGYGTANAPRMGDQITGLEGVLDYSWAGFSASGSTWRVRSAEDGANEFTRGVNPRPEGPPDVGGTLQVASFNVLNYFTTLDDGSLIANGQEPRGANTDAEFARQREKLLTTLLTLDADIVGLNELENDFLAGSAGNAIADIVAGLNEILGSEVWAWIDPGTQFVGTDAIAVGMIYRTDEVRLAEGTVVDYYYDGAFVGLGRAPLAASFEDLDSGEVFTVVVNHFKSKSATGATGANLDQNDGQGAFNAARVAQAEELAAWIATDPTGADDPDVLIIGDLNAYRREDPIGVLEEAGYTVLEEEGDYSYVFDGQTGSLDHALASSSLLTKVTSAKPWGINADEADALDYNLDFGRDPAIFDGSVPFRTSDHDPVLVGLDFTPDPATLAFDIWWTSSGDASRDTWRGSLDRVIFEQTSSAGVRQTDDRDDEGPLTAGGVTLSGADGDFELFGARFTDNTGTRASGSDPLFRVDWNTAGTEALVELLRPWNSWKNLEIDAFDGASLRVENFVHVSVQLGDAEDDQRIELQGVKRAGVVTGAGDDEIVVGIDSNGSLGDLFTVDAGAGNDVVRLGAADASYAAAVFGCSIFDQRAITEVVLGAGNDVLWGTAAGRDTAIYADSLADVSFAEITGGVRVTTLSEGVDELYGVEFVELAGVRYALDTLIG